MYNKLEQDSALSSIGTTFEELSDDEIMNTDAAVAPFLISLGKILLSALGGSAVTFTIDKIKA